MKRSATITTPAIPPVDRRMNGHGVFVVQAAADRLPDDAAELLQLAGLTEAATATTPAELAHATLTTLTGQVMVAMRALATEHQAAGLDVRQALLIATEYGGAIDEAVQVALNNVMREYPRS
ncbi:hypothetical protein SSP531S_24580 [Streptomyces spongiicola]|uniref:Uncharacterized protein n=1 Tax=Streptomyces spongiicola TaxID=1690221 RepID=A0A388SWK6_9ACTN|nr:hypothetical protein [Streptomyces spongiicola]GBQ01028.1 hypothetical protein SSP531S_24580 [Streptomyces spongiicola]